MKPARRKVAGPLALGAIGSAAVAAKAPETTRRRYAALGAPAGPYAHGIRHGDLLFLSGLTAYGTPAQKGDIAVQADATLARIAAVAAEEGATWDRWSRSRSSSRISLASTRCASGCRRTTGMRRRRAP